ncbi:hypothetical protein HFU84_04365 [Acidithiobacillus sp. CV18-2]|uniref:Uncharacterized protein n=1 Tax=Igneacidithiobacillus copahuensis TaxID=2724909 RepID=A0AAE3CKX0_9PROT|nr:hypothetical protein [Igneacidithiobacillus copahuensis]MBU2754170.1 hypothetical protein [Acidithiobacillus sp. CV18-3]MBU2758477.1 hypothetical protein [Acidithiobacillus sp. BN09-2]MBU2776750.1 hypothetical protein [Acidithiobacillus sp. CV18-2]MBU2797074.1 hypothetical protein [Acidithiobacillus sp. VAN18-2]MBU2798477.1 hypothetical protein [Acidithiobacillus sp. VAN18-4]UTV80144.1 hypothetical protein MQE22_08920 [Acidithiobacillus sp. YTS05]
MNEDNTGRLLQAFPTLYRVALPWGFECDDGWFDILWQLSTVLEGEATAAGISHDSGHHPYATQIKSKFGMLRWYGEHLSDAMSALVDEASGRSRHTCEVCGADGHLRVYRRWYMTCCDNHAPSGSQSV